MQSAQCSARGHATSKRAAQSRVHSSLFGVHCALFTVHFSLFTSRTVRRRLSARSFCGRLLQVLCRPLGQHAAPAAARRSRTAKCVWAPPAGRFYRHGPAFAPHTVCGVSRWPPGAQRRAKTRRRQTGSDMAELPEGQSAPRAAALARLGRHSSQGEQVAALRADADVPLRGARQTNALKLTPIGHSQPANRGAVFAFGQRAAVALSSTGHCSAGRPALAARPQAQQVRSPMANRPPRTEDPCGQPPGSVLAHKQASSSSGHFLCALPADRARSPAASRPIAIRRKRSPDARVAPSPAATARRSVGRLVWRSRARGAPSGRPWRQVQCPFYTVDTA